MIRHKFGMNDMKVKIIANEFQSETFDEQHKFFYELLVILQTETSQVPEFFSQLPLWLYNAIGMLLCDETVDKRFTTEILNAVPKDSSKCI